MGGKFAFNGEYDTAGLYDIEAEATGINFGGFTVPKAKVRVRNFDVPNTAVPNTAVPNTAQTCIVPTPPQPVAVTTKAGTPRTPIAQTIDIDIAAKLATFGDATFIGKFGVEDNTVGFRLSGCANIVFSEQTKALLKVTYSNFPKDAGFGLFGTVAAGPVTLQVGGIFRKVTYKDNEQEDQEATLYRVGASIKIPVWAPPDIVAQGTAQVDNCVNVKGTVNVPSTACGKPRLTGTKGGVVTPQIKIAAAVEIGGGLVTAAVEGTIGFDGAFRLIGSAQAGMNMGPWGFFGVITAEAGFTMSFGVCIANDIATGRPEESRMGCGRKLDQKWVVGIEGKVWASITIDLWLFKSTTRLEAYLAGVIYPASSKFCARFLAFGFGITFGTCPNPGEIPAANPTLLPGDY